MKKSIALNNLFSITNADARQLNQSAVNLERTTSYMSYGIFVGIGVILVLLADAVDFQAMTRDEKRRKTTHDIKATGLSESSSKLKSIKCSES